MAGRWSATDFRDNFHDAIMKLVEAKAKAGDTETVEPLEEAPEAQGADVIDLTELLRRSLKGGAKAASAPAPARKTASRKKPERERAVAAAAPRKRASSSKRTSSKPARAKRAA
jgi:DNA end-binding protein Ku